MHPEMNLLIDNIRKSQTTDEMTDNCIRLIIKYGDAINIVPEYHKGLIRSCTAFEPGEKYKYNNIFNITQSWRSVYMVSSWKYPRSNIGNIEWKYKSLYLSASAQCGAGIGCQLDAIDEKMGNPRGIHDINHSLCFYELFNKMDMLFHLCCNKVEGLNIDKNTKPDSKQTRWENLIIEMKYPESTPEYRADVCTRLITNYDYYLNFVPVYNPNKAIKYAVKVNSNFGGKKQRVFAVCKKNDGGFAIIYSKENYQIADKDETPQAIPVFGTLLDLCKSKAK